MFVLELRASTFELADFSTFSTEKSCVSVGSRSPLRAGAAQSLGSWFCFLFLFFSNVLDCAFPGCLQSNSIHYREREKEKKVNV